MAESKLAAAFQANLVRLRKSRKLTQESLANKADISISYVSMLERGQRVPPLETVEAIAAALDVNPAYRMLAGRE